MDHEQSRPAIRVAVAAPFAQLVSIHERAAEFADEIELCGAISDASRVLEQSRRLQPEVLLLSEEFGFDWAEFSAQLSTVAPITRLVMLGGVSGAGTSGDADTVLSADAPAAALRGAIVTAARRIDVDTAPAAHSRGAAAALAEVGGATASDEVIAAEGDADGTGPAPRDEADAVARTVLLFSGKGGVGTSVFAANLATALAVSGRRVALVDLNLQFGDVGVLLHLEAHATTIESLAAPAGGALEPVDLDSALASTPEGLRVLLAPRSPELADLVTAEGLGSILDELARAHDYLVVDSPAHLEERILGVVEMADDILLVTSPSITAVKDTKMTLRLLQSLGIESEKVAVVLNHTRARVGFAADDIERALRFPLLATLPYEPRMDESIDSGRPLVLSEPRSGFSRQLDRVVAHLGRERAAGGGRTPREQPARWRRRFSAT